MLLPPLSVSPDQFYSKLLLTGGVGAITWLIMWPFRKLKKEWEGASKKLDVIQEELLHQRTNHLTHIERHTKDTVSVLDKIRENQIEMNGYLKGITRK